MKRLLSLVVPFAAVLAATAQPRPLPNAHAHNDYEHPRPLFDALDHGFTSVEADVYLVEGALLIAHDREDVQPGRTLQALYLDPLRDRARQNGHRIYPDGPPFYLLIDIKSEAETTYAALRTVLRQYADLLTIFTPTTAVEGAVTAIISGNRPRATMAAEPVRFAAFDGRLDDLDATPDLPTAFMPLVSSNWAMIAPWYGEGIFPAEARKRLQEAVAKAHAQGRRLRFWATSDNPAVWRVLHEAGVDLLNADDLSGLQTFLLQQETP